MKSEAEFPEIHPDDIIIDAISELDLIVAREDG
jgi:hypothetical protein